MSYIPGSGLKKPLNQLDNPIYPDIKKGPPRFKWTRKHWTVDEGRTQMQVEHIPQIQEAAVLAQSRDYNKQHAYGNFPKYTTFVNKEFRPPLIERDDLLPLSRVPRPVIIPRSNPGTAFAGGSAFAEQNMGLSQTESYLTDRVKAGEIRPTFFAPISMPEDNSILPDLELTLPATSASAGYSFPTAMEGVSNNHMQNLELDYKSIPVASSAGRKMPAMDSYNAFEDAQLEYNRPQVSAAAKEYYRSKGMTPIEFVEEFGYNRPQIAATTSRSMYSAGMTPVDIENLEYNRPQISAASSKSMYAKGLTPIDFSEDLEYNRPQTSVTSGYAGYVESRNNNGVTPVELALEQKLAGTQGGVATATYSSIYDPNERGMQESATNLTDAQDITHYSYVVPSTTVYQTANTTETDHFFRQKQAALGRQHEFQVKGHVRRAGLDAPQVKLRMRKG
ncbi:MAG TPA: hypothetical protein PKD85_06725 [Saprospiraceae bacterium]|nr:hypothetical protein [Saprospiraceae bacterium]